MWKMPLHIHQNMMMRMIAIKNFRASVVILGGKAKTLLKKSKRQETFERARELEGASENLRNEISYKGFIIQHFIRVCTVCYDKIDLQRK